MPKKESPFAGMTLEERRNFMAGDYAQDLSGISEKDILEDIFNEGILVERETTNLIDGDKQMNRGQILDNAKAHTIGDRDVEYGSPYDNMGNIAALWTTHLQRKYGAFFEVKAEDVAYMNMLQKLARTYSSTSSKPDTFEDMAAYAAIGGECEMINQVDGQEDNIEL